MKKYSSSDRKQLVDPFHDEISVRRQCSLLGVCRSAVYYEPKKPKKKRIGDIELMTLIDEQYTDTPFYGSRKIAIAISLKLGITINRKRVRRLMQLMGLTAIYAAPNTSKANKQHKKYPYLLRGLLINKPNMVWVTDITYVRLKRGFVYLVAIIDWYSRKVLSWRLSNTMDAQFCIDALKEALEKYGSPEYFNTDQGAQFTSDAFCDVLKEHHVKISMDGKGRALDNVFTERLWRTVKYENIYLKGYETIIDALLGLTDYFHFYNSKRIHAHLDYATPDQVFQGLKITGTVVIEEKILKKAA